MGLKTFTVTYTPSGNTMPGLFPGKRTMKVKCCSAGCRDDFKRDLEDGLFVTALDDGRCSNCLNKEN